MSSLGFFVVVFARGCVHLPERKGEVEEESTPEWGVVMPQSRLQFSILLEFEGVCLYAFSVFFKPLGPGFKPCG